MADLADRKGLADSILAEKAALRDRERRQDRPREPDGGFRSHSLTNSRSSSSRSISRSRSPPRTPPRTGGRHNLIGTPMDTPRQTESPNRKRKRSPSSDYRSTHTATSMENDFRRSLSLEEERNVRRRRAATSPDERGRSRSRSSHYVRRRRSRSASSVFSRKTRPRLRSNPQSPNPRQNPDLERSLPKQPDGSTRHHHDEVPANGSTVARPPRQRSLSPYSRRVALTQKIIGE